MCQKCEECQDTIHGKEVLEIVVEKIKQKKFSNGIGSLVKDWGQKHCH